MPWSPNSAYDSLPPLPPAAAVETHAVLKAVIESRAALATLSASAAHLPNASIIINAIPLLEAQASSAIENIVTTTDDLFAAAAAPALETSATRETLRYRSALRIGWDEVRARPLTAATTERICAQIRGHAVSARTTPVVIGDPVSQTRVYTPPAAPTAIKDLLDNWSRFVNADLPGTRDLDPVLAMAIAHYQFEAIHPFTDGNGRTGRIVNVLMLCAAGILPLPLLYLSREIIETKDEYYRRLLAVTAERDWEGWLVYMALQVERSAKRTVALISQVFAVETELTDACRAHLGAVNADFVRTLMEQPYTRVRNVMEIARVSRPTATKWLKELTNADVLDERRVGREVLYINRSLLRTLASHGD
ncbi:Fic family protein [Rarobacter incanus]|uniref:Fic family protein n=1 Tax=Rarobacter incanus TaxID=153494 RepID=A0A542SMZ7_9MICO|nr:Fic/DOC family N-terminal domain-containing protein [Rarobacter incanus]TQK76006.1 Fic family protein [Rarobacter incanus]